MRSVLLSSFLYLPLASGFVVLEGRSSQKSVRLSVAGQSDAVSEVDRLRERIAKLRADAAAAEASLEADDMLHKMARQNEKTDAMIDGIFQNREAGSSIVNQLAHYRMDTLLRITERLDERVAHAEGCVIVVEKNGNKEFESVTASPNPEEAERLNAWIDGLLVATKSLDGTEGNHFESFEHQLSTRLHELRRERSEEYKKRMDLLREASRLKDDDDHKFHGYHDMGTMN